MGDIIERFQNTYKRDNYKVVYSPYRICPLGAHVDHQHGWVTGMALDHGIEFVFSPREDGYIRISSADFPDEEMFHIDQVPAYIPGSWGNYMRGAVLALQSRYRLRYGLDGVAHGNLPIGGLSSSAAVSSAYLLALADVNGLNISRKELIELSSYIENEYIGLNNGILDQASNLLSRDGYLLYLDTRTEEYELVKKPDNMPDFEVAVVYSGISKTLISTDYNNRVDECKAAAWFMQAATSDEISSFKEVRLRDIDEHIYEMVVAELPERFRKRARHFFEENKRVREGVKAWKEGDIKKFGQLMFQSGESSIQNYECGCPELISIYEILRETPGIYGARFSGAGYRGCCIGLIDPSYKDIIKEKVTKEYLKKYPHLEGVFQVDFCKTDDGARIL
ncbi:MAG: galactokinase family protein [Clostridia bacterium]